MTNIMQQLEQAEIARVTEGKQIPAFKAGDNVKVHVRITEGSTTRVQAFEGVVIARRNAGLHSSFTVRKLSSGEGVEKVFPLYSPRIEKIEVVRYGKVRRAKLYYLRGRTGKAARITEERIGKREAQLAKMAKKANTP